MITSKALTEMKVPHSIVVEPQEFEKYQAAVKQFKLLAQIIELDMCYKEKYELCDDLGLTKSTGSGPARNFIWDHSISRGHKWHWIMDDNITGFHRLNNNLKHKVKSGAFFKAMEDFVLRYSNVAMAGPQYEMFVPRKTKVPPFITNTRLYSCNFIRNDVPFRWRGRYNEDTILSIDMLKAGWCTIQFNAFLQKKMGTQVLRGGNTDELYNSQDKREGEKYSKTGTTAKSEMLVRVHPDVARVAWKFGRVHHHVDFRPFKSMRLVRRKDIEILAKANEYGMKLKSVCK